jgi:hypothetical protein
MRAVRQRRRTNEEFTAAIECLRSHDPREQPSYTGTARLKYAPARHWSEDKICAARFHKYELGCNMRRLVDDGFKGTLLERKQGSRCRECCIKRDSRLINVEASNLKTTKIFLGHKNFTPN